jgi:hypothetical protein
MFVTKPASPGKRLFSFLFGIVKIVKNQRDIPVTMAAKCASPGKNGKNYLP